MPCKKEEERKENLKAFIIKKETTGIWITWRKSRDWIGRLWYMGMGWDK